jgi:hypothetical protein
MIGVRNRETAKFPQNPNLRVLPRYPIRAAMRIKGRTLIITGDISEGAELELFSGGGGFVLEGYGYLFTDLQLAFEFVLHLAGVKSQ